VTQAALPTLSKLYLEGQPEKPKQQQTAAEKSLYLSRQKTTGNNKARAFCKSSIFSTSRQACLDFLFYLPLSFAPLECGQNKSGNQQSISGPRYAIFTAIQESIIMGFKRCAGISAALAIMVLSSRAALATDPNMFTDWRPTSNLGVSWRWCKPVSGGFLAFYKKLDCTNEVPHYASRHGGNAISIWCRDVDCGRVSVEVVFLDGSLIVEGTNFESHTIPRGTMANFLFHTYSQEAKTTDIVRINASGLATSGIAPW